MCSEIYHHGILGMRWGKRNGPPYPLSSSSKSSAEKKAEKESGTERKTYSAKQLRSLSDEDLRDAVNRLKMEKQYIEYAKFIEDNTKQISKGKSFISKVLEKSGDNIATQATTYTMGKVVNKISNSVTGEDAVNPKKRQN